MCDPQFSASGILSSISDVRFPHCLSLFLAANANLPIPIRRLSVPKNICLSVCLSGIPQLGKATTKDGQTCCGHHPYIQICIGQPRSAQYLENEVLKDLSLSFDYLVYGIRPLHTGALCFGNSPYVVASGLLLSVSVWRKVCKLCNLCSQIHYVESHH